MEIARDMGKTFVSVKGKIRNLGLSLKDTPPPRHTGASSSSLDLSLGLPSLEEKLKVMNAALVALEQPDLSRNEISRLRSIILGVKEYRVEFEKFVGYRELELLSVELTGKVEEAKREILEMRRKLEESKLENSELRKRLEESKNGSGGKKGSDVSSS
jgi:hypothetical protein